MFEHLRQSKISESELKQEIIKDLTEQKYKGEWNKKQMKRNVSSQFSNYVEQRNLTEVSPLNQQIRGESSNARKARDQ